MTLWHNRLRRRLGTALHNRRGFRGNIDTVSDNTLIGWVHASRSDQRPLTVGLYTSQGLLLEAVANVHRGDLEAAGLGACGFALPISSVTRAVIAKNGGKVTVRVMGGQGFLVGKYSFPPRDTEELAGAALKNGAATSGNMASTGRSQALYGDLGELAALLARVAENPPPAHGPKLARHGAMFSNIDYIHDRPLPAPVSAYQDYVRYRNRHDRAFDLSEMDTAPDTTSDTARHFLRFYLDFFGPARGGLRIPLPKAALERFNAPVQIDGHTFELTNISWSYLVDDPIQRQNMNLANPAWCFGLAYWWSLHKCNELHAEDCLVPAHYIALLADIAEEHLGGEKDVPFPLSRFMVQHHIENAYLHDLGFTTETDRRDITLALMIKAIQRPDYLRYIPAESVTALLAETTNGGSALSEFANKHTREDIPAFGRTAYAQALRVQGFDLERLEFLSITPEGDRFEAAGLVPVTGDTRVDIQMIGPFQKASGLGQATRLSASVLAHTGYSVNAVNFGLDNPAPEGFSRVGTLSDYKPAKVNLIHLNAESIPMVFAYQPDVFSDAYNIGYFYWELDSPAACHYLGLDLLDEVWVSTDYGVSIYKPTMEDFAGETDPKPVVNVGMCYEDLPEIPRADARSFVCEQFGFDGSEFVFLVAFDSFSFVQRKNPVGLLRAFRDAFKGDENVRLVVKTQNRRKIADPVQIAVWDEIDIFLRDDARIVLLDETLDYDDLLRLKKGSDCYVSLHKSEGWGFGMIEAMNLKVPVVCTAYSGNMDFCRAEHTWLVDYELVELEQDDYIFVRQGQKWAEPDHDDAVRQLRAVYENPEERRARADAAWKFVQKNFSSQAIAKRYETRLDEIFQGLK